MVERGEKERFPDSVPCSNSLTFVVGSCTAMACSGDQGRAVGVQYCVESLSPATPKGSPGRSTDNVASRYCGEVPTRPCSKAEGSTFFCPFHPLTVFHLTVAAVQCAANNLQIPTALSTSLHFTSKCTVAKHFHSQHVDHMRLLCIWSLNV